MDHRKKNPSAKFELLPNVPMISCATHKTMLFARGVSPDVGEKIPIT
jgi:hypothetical protein